MLRYLRLTFECIAAFIGVGIVLALLVVWRLSSSPVTSDFMTPYIAAAIESLIPDSDAHVGATLLTWNGEERSVAMHADNITITDAAGADIAVVPAIDAKISLIGLIFGQFMPKDLVIEHPQIKLTRNANGAFVFGGMAMGGGEPGNANKSPHKDTVFVLHNVAERLSHAILMHKLAVTHAVVEVHDAVTQKDWAVSVPEISVTRTALSAIDHRLHYGALDGRMTVEVTQKDEVASLDIKYSYDPQKEQHVFQTIFSGLTPAFVAGGHPETLGINAAAIIDLPLTGKIQVTLDKDLAVQDLSAVLHGDEGQLIYSDFWDQPCPIKSVDINADYARDIDKLKVSLAHIDFGGPTLDVNVEGTPPTQSGHDLDFTAAIALDNMPMNSYGALWPKPVLPDPRYWLVANLRDGTFTHGEVNLKGAVAWDDLANLSITSGAGKMSAVGGRVTYMDGMPPVEGVSADATFDLKKMAVRINGGGIGNIRVTPFTLQIAGLADTDQSIDIPLRLSGPLPDILRLLDHPPLGYAKKIGLSPDDLSGQIDGAVHFSFPLLKTLEMKDLDIHATANATAVASTKLVPGLAIDQGDLALTLDMDGFNLNGQAALDKIPAQITWQESFSQQPGKALRHATVTGTIKDDQWTNLGITAFNGTKGPVNLSLDMTKPDKNKMILSGTLDMTPAALKVEMLDWKKPANSAAILKFIANAPPGKPVAITSLSLRGAQISADGNARLSSDMTQLLSLNFSRFILGRTNTALRFSQTYGPTGSLKFDATGSALDVSGLRGGNEPDQADPRPKEYHVQVAKLYTGESGEIDNAQGFAVRDQEGWSAINLHGVADGDTPLNIELTPQPDGHRTLVMACDNFGKAMKGLGFTDTIKGGTLSVTGESAVDAPRLIVGHARVDNFTIQKLPALALLLNATSPFGFSGIITDSADFSRFEGDFNWQGDVLSLTRAHAAGSAIGINVDGKVDMNTGDSNLQGTLVPFSTLNNILNFVPLVGGLITGGENQGVLAISYQIKGPLNAPKITVNPVSLLTPGFIRNLFFRDDTVNDTKE